MKRHFSLTTGFLIIVASCVVAQHIYASDEISASGLSYLHSQQAENGSLNGFGGESQWGALAFLAHGMQPYTVQQSDKTLEHFLLSDVLNSTSTATAIERQILALVAMRYSPVSSGGINYVQKLEETFSNGQFGEETQLNDDIFAVLALVASGELADTAKLQSSLDFVLAHQHSGGGFSWTTATCAWCGADSNDTAAAIQALAAVKQTTVSLDGVDDALSRALSYLLTLQTADGGFRYDETSEPDGASTAWAAMALIAAGGHDEKLASAQAWLKQNQEADGGFHWMSGYGSDTSTTSHALIALANKSWLLRIYTASQSGSPSPFASASASPSPSVSPSPSPTASTSPSPTASTQAVVSPLPSPSPTPDLRSQSAQQNVQEQNDKTNTEVTQNQAEPSLPPSPSPVGQVLGSTDTTPAAWWTRWLPFLPSMGLTGTLGVLVWRRQR